MDEHGCDTCLYGDETPPCKRCSPPEHADDLGVDAWEPSHAYLRAQLDAANRTIDREREVYRLALEEAKRELDEARRELQHLKNGIGGADDELLTENRLLREALERLRAEMLNENVSGWPNIAQHALESAPLTTAEAERVKRLEEAVRQIATSHPSVYMDGTGEVVHSIVGPWHIHKTPGPCPICAALSGEFTLMIKRACCFVRGAR